MSADSRQVGGDHYRKMKIQPWDFLKACLTRAEYIGWAKGVIITYHARARLKGGDQDLLKAHHHAEDLAEYLKANPEPERGLAAVEPEPEPEPARRHEAERRLREALEGARGFLLYATVAAKERDDCLATLRDIKDALAFADDHKPEPDPGAITFVGTVANGWFSAKGSSCLGIVPDYLIGMAPFGCRARVTILPDAPGESVPACPATEDRPVLSEWELVGIRRYVKVADRELDAVFDKATGSGSDPVELNGKLQEIRDTLIKRLKSL